jgi:hypothetical protein
MFSNATSALGNGRKPMGVGGGGWGEGVRMEGERYDGNGTMEQWERREEKKTYFLI